MLEQIKMLLARLSETEKRELIKYLQGSSPTYPGQGQGEARQKGIHTGPMNTGERCPTCGR